MEYKKATRKKVKIKMSIASPTGFGKTFSALKMAKGIVGKWEDVALIDSENESASLYEHLGNFNVVNMEAPYTVDSLCEAIDLCVSKGAKIIIVDSAYHYWHGKGGVLDYVGSLGGRFQDWAKGSPKWQQFVDKILLTPVHVICTLRKKQAYEIVTGQNGKKEVEKKGMEDQVRDGFDYEMTVAFEILNDKHLAKAAKDRTGMFMDKQEFVISEKTGEQILAWCEKGIELLPEKQTLPACTNKAVDSAIKRYEKEKDVFDKLRAAFTLTEDQEQKINDAAAK